MLKPQLQTLGKMGKGQISEYKQFIIYITYKFQGKKYKYNFYNKVIWSTYSIKNTKPKIMVKDKLIITDQQYRTHKIQFEQFYSHIV